ncbi:unnamed protein product [Heligmosomoides polygyrus]|uniref:PPM-type phosphatase domain-containing protein n=1 Tax=Heligmosomoides polygyrus TaxID=6339 RepID=A0A183GEB4_HELPZ|nr:unnamed protein product [Heligmosomoides polygyrus]
MDEFWSLLDEKTTEVPSEDMIVVAGDLSGHVEATKDAYSCQVVLHMGRATPMRERQNTDILVRRRDQGLDPDAKTVPYETVDGSAMWGATDAITGAARFEFGTTKIGGRWVDKQALKMSERKSEKRNGSITY